MRSILVVLAVFSLAAGCDSAAENAKEPSKGAPVQQASEHVHDLICGCALPEVGHCGEYIEVDGAFVVLAGDLGLGKMPFCGKKGLKAEVDGEMTDGKFVATSFKYVE